MPARAVERAKSGTCPTPMIGLGFFDDGPVGDPDANVRLYDFLKEQN